MPLDLDEAIGLMSRYQRPTGSQQLVSQKAREMERNLVQKAKRGSRKRTSPLEVLGPKVDLPPPHRRQNQEEDQIKNSGQEGHLEIRAITLRIHMIGLDLTLDVWFASSEQIDKQEYACPYESCIQDGGMLPSTQ